MTSETGNWCLTFPCTRREADQLTGDDDPFWQLDAPPTLTAREPDAAFPDRWELSAYFNHKPSEYEIELVQSLIPSAGKAVPRLEALPDADWVTMSQQGLAPVMAGRFFVHTARDAAAIPSGSVPFLIEASRAFGTGGHDTTQGCLVMLDRLKRQGQIFDNVVDIGTGTGLLAFAARHLWPRAYVTASDIDPVSIDISVENAAANNVPMGALPGQLALCVASGTDHPLIQQRAPYDLVIANILAGPLIELAPALSAILRDGGTLVLAGLLDHQVAAVKAAYWRVGLRLAEARGGEWPCLRLVKRHRLGWRRPVRPRLRTSQPPGDFGTW
ncbi:MAG: 50S ribosomal protein L11 methyltransferase [Chakrabartia sp.]